jgi:Ca2+-binding RTX toxin-like protein
MTNFTGIAGRLNRYIGTASADSFRFAAADLDGDTLFGLGGRDLLHITTAGVVGATALANMSGIESIVLAPGGNNLTLVDANYADISGTRITIFGGAGDDVIDASGLTGGRGVEFRAGGGANVLRGGAGADIFRMQWFDAQNSTLSGGNGNDRLVLTTTGNFNVAPEMSGIESIVFSAGWNYITLSNQNFVDVTDGRITIIGSAGGGSVDARALSSGHAVSFTARGNVSYFLGEMFEGGAGNDILRVTSGILNNVRARAGAGIDTLQLGRNTSLSAFNFENVSQFEIIALSAGNNSLVLSASSLDDIVTDRLTVVGNSGNDRIDGSGLTGPLKGVLFDSRGGIDVLLGSEASDQFRFAADDLNGDTLTGRNGSDELVVTRGGEVTAADLANMTGVETITLLSGGVSLALDDANFAVVASEIITVNGSTGTDTIDGSAVASDGGLAIEAGTGTDVLIGGGRADTLAGGADADTMTGGGNADWFVWRSKTEGGDTITDFTRLEDQLAFDAVAFTVAGDTFDSIVAEDDLGPTGINNVDLLTFNAYAIDSGAEFRAMIAGNYGSTSHGMFALVFNSNNDVVLYYTSDASLAGSDDPAGDYHQIANLGQLPGGLSLEVSDFVFI